MAIRVNWIKFSRILRKASGQIILREDFSTGTSSSYTVKNIGLIRKVCNILRCLVYTLNILQFARDQACPGKLGTYLRPYEIQFDEDVLVLHQQDSPAHFQRDTEQSTQNPVP